jgi:hypothetical protein
MSSFVVGLFAFGSRGAPAVSRFLTRNRNCRVPGLLVTPGATRAVTGVFTCELQSWSLVTSCHKEVEVDLRDRLHARIGRFSDNVSLNTFRYRIDKLLQDTRPTNSPSTEAELRRTDRPDAHPKL